MNLVSGQNHHLGDIEDDMSDVVLDITVSLLMWLALC